MSAENERRKIEALRRELLELHASADALSLDEQIKTCAAAEKLWQHLAEDCIAQAHADDDEGLEGLGPVPRALIKKTRDEQSRELLKLAIRCTTTANAWSTERRQAQKAAKADLLRELEARLNHEDEVAMKFAGVVEERARHAKMVSLRLERASRADGKPTGLRGQPQDRGAEEAG